MKSPIEQEALDAILKSARKVVDTGREDIYYDSSFDTQLDLEEGDGERGPVTMAVDDHLRALVELEEALDALS